MEEKIDGRRPARGIREMKDLQKGSLEMVFYEKEAIKELLY